MLDPSHELLDEELDHETVTDQWLDNDDGMFEETAADGSDLQQPSSYTKRKQKAAERWQFVQSVAFSAVVMNMAEPKLNCAMCKESIGVVKCYQCGPHMYYCESCAIKIHHNSLFHHYMEIWQVCEYIYTYAKVAKIFVIYIYCRMIIFSHSNYPMVSYWILTLTAIKSFGKVLYVLV